MGESNSTETKTKILDLTANPAALGLLGFGMTTVLVSLHNAGIFDLGTMILAMGIFYGGLAQIFAGWMEWKKGNTFGMVAFSSYGLFWLTFVGLLTLPAMNLGFLAPEPTALGFYLVMWGIFTAVMFIGTLKINTALQAVFGTLTILFFLLALGEFTGNGAITQLAGYEGILCGALAVYAGLAQVLNEVYGKIVAPLDMKDM